MLNGHVLITGGAQGVGLAVAERFLAAGAKITITGRNEERLAEAKQALGIAGSVLTVAADVSDEAAVADLFEKAEAAHGPVNVLVNNAGISGSAPLARMSVEHFDDMMGVNARGVFLCSRAAAGPMAKNGGGRIINIASTAGLKGYAYVAAYVASKHAAVGLTRALAQETAKKSVTVNALCPGFTETPLLAESIDTIMKTTGRSEAEARKSLARSNPQGRFIQPEEVAASALYLCGDDAHGITGQALSISGGET